MKTQQLTAQRDVCPGEPAERPSSVAHRNGGPWQGADTAFDVAGLGKRLREVRERYEWTRADVARLCGGRCSASALGTYERGERVMTAVSLFALADLYRVPAIELFDGKPTKLAAPAVGAIVIDTRRLGESVRWPRLTVFIDAVQRARQGPRPRLVALRNRDLPGLAALHGETVDRFLALLAADGLISGVEPS
ncbi:MAG: hypothetical protein QOE71_3663 [Pseudonocardiales bacterium]|nr:hypothetical protein [Pseudonocardiales bacterium]MDQ1752607.1 hypothetical protein [Pseudonocardiales bacterium]